MAIRTRTPGRAWSSVAPYSNYTSTVANYAAAMGAAIQSQKNTEIESKILDYKNGIVTYDELVTFLNSKLAAEQPGSARELEIRNILTDVENYERKQKIGITRAKLTEKFAKGGISASEQRQIEEEILNLYKPGTADYSAQLAEVATARELERVEKNNSKVASLQAELSKGGLTTGEQIQVYKEMARYAESGSQEKLDIESKIGALGEQKRKEDQEIKMNQKLSQMLDQYEGGGISNEEALAMNREMQRYVDPGSQEEVSLKQQEAGLLGDIAQGSGVGNGGGVGGSTKGSYAQEIAIQTAQLKELEAAFAAGKLNPQEYMQKQEAVLSLIAPQDIPEGAISMKDMYELKQRFAEFEQMKQLVQGGQAVPVKVGNQQVLIPTSELSSFRYSDEVAISDLNPETNEVIEGSEKVGRIITLLNPDGSERKVSINDDGTFSNVTATKKWTVNADGTVSTVTAYTRSPEKTASASEFIGTLTKPGPTTATKGPTAAMPTTPSVPTTAKGTSIGALAGSAVGGAGKLLSAVSPSPVATAKKVGTIAGNIAGSLAGPVGSAAGAYVGSKVGSAVNTASTSLFNKVKNTASNLWSGVTNLFKGA